MEIDGFSVPRIDHGNDNRRTILDEPHLCDQACVEDSVNSVPVIHGLFA
jgi:hypothetical protein